MMHFKEVLGFPPPGYRPKNLWMIGFRKWFPSVALLFVIVAQHGFFPEWVSIGISIVLISFSIFTMFVAWYIILLLLFFKFILKYKNVIKSRDILEFIIPVFLTYVLWSGQWIFTSMFYGVSVCSIIGVYILHEIISRRETKC